MASGTQRHLDVKVPVAIIGAIFVQTVVIVWTASSYVARNDARLEKLEQFQKDFTARADVAREERVRNTQIITNQITAIQENLNGVNKSVDRLISTVDRLNDKLQDERAPK